MSLNAAGLGSSEDDLEPRHRTIADAQAVPGQGDGTVAGVAHAADRPIPEHGPDRGPPPRTGATLRAALHGGGRAPACRGGRDPRRPVRHRHEAGDATPVRDLRGSAIRAAGGAVQRPPLPPARERDLPPASDLVAKTRPVRIGIGERREPHPGGRPGFLRVDSVHQGDLDGKKGIYPINVVDEVTQYEFVGTVEANSGAFLVSVRSCRYVPPVSNC